MTTYDNKFRDKLDKMLVNTGIDMFTFRKMYKLMKEAEMYDAIHHIYGFEISFKEVNKEYKDAYNDVAKLIYKEEDLDASEFLAEKLTNWQNIAILLENNKDDLNKYLKLIKTL